jgi:hypothetical protein
VLLTLSAKRAAAYTIETQVTQGCHEGITGDALREVRLMNLALPLPSTEQDDGPLLDDLPFSLANDEKDIGAAAMILGVRDNDIKDLSPEALDELGQLTADPALQREHCLRSDTEREPDGTAQAVADCRAFIKQRLLDSLDGLGTDGAPDGQLRQPLTVTLALRGRYTVSVPMFYVRFGQAAHAIQDSFTHTFRDVADPHKITETLDWIDYASNHLNEAQDGPPHMSELDRCDDPDPLRTQRHHLAIEATAVALQIAVDPTLSRDAKGTAFDDMLDTYISYSDEGCTQANAWCNAPENAYRSNGCGCELGKAGAGQRGASVLGGLIVTLFALRRRRARAVVRGVTLTVLALLTLGAPRLALAQGEPGQAATPAADHRAAGAPPPPAEQTPTVLKTPPASAQKETVLPTAPEHAPQGPAAALSGTSSAATPGLRDPAGSVFLHAAAAASYDNPALSFALGGKYQLSSGWMVGLDAEWNPWLPKTPFRFRAGTGNAYATLVRRYQFGYEPVNFRTTAALGASTLLIDLPGAQKWGVGPLAGISFLGVEWKVHPGYYLVVDPTYFTMVAPHLTGTPLVYYQYRFQVALEIGG